MERPAQLRHGPVSRVDEQSREKLRKWLAKQPDLTLAELRERLAGNGVRISRSRVHQVVEQLGLRRKKIPPRPGAGHRRRPPPAPSLVEERRSDRG